MPLMPATTLATIDLDGAYEQMGDDLELLQEIVEIFVESVPQLLQNIATGIEQGDSAQVEMHAHSMKGSASNICAVAVVETARELEVLAHDGSLEGAPDMHARLGRLLDELTGTLATVDWNAVGSS